MHKSYTCEETAEEIIEDVAERDAFQSGTQLIRVSPLRERHEAERLTRLAVEKLAGSTNRNQPTLDELCSAARNHVANSSRPAPSDVPF